MAYAPGVQNVSGQLLAQGISGGIGSFMQNWGRQVEKQERDRQMLAQAKATENYIKTNPELFGGKEQVNLLLSVDPNEAPVARYQKLQGLMENTIAGNKIRASQMQEAAMRQQQEMQAIALQQAREQQAQLENLRRLSQFAQPTQVPTGAVAPGRGPMNAMPPMNPQMGGPASLGSMMQPGIAGGGVLSPTAQRNMGQQLQQPGMMEALQILQQTGGLPSPDAMIRTNTERMQLKGAGSGGGYNTMEEAVKAAKDGGATSVSVQQNSAGKYVVQASFAGDKPNMMEVILPGGRKASVGPGNRWFDESGKEMARPTAPRILDPMNWQLAKMSMTQSGASKDEADRAFGTNYVEYEKMQRGEKTGAAAPTPSAPSSRFKVLEIK